MGSRVPLRQDFGGETLRRLAKQSKDANQTRRLLALAAIYDGASRSEAAKIGGVTLQIIRDWVLRFNAEGPDGLIDRKARGVGAGLVLPRCNTAMMQLHLNEIATQVAPGAHALVLLDQAGWHMTGKLDVPDNITLMALPPKAPELNPVENVWQFMRENWLSNRIFKSQAEIVAQCFADDADLARELVSAGFACDWIKFSGGHYSQDRPDSACPR